MKQPLLLLFLPLLILLSSCAGTKKVQADEEFEVITESEKKLLESIVPAIDSAKQELHQKVYFLQHRLLPHWTHNSEGEFYKAMTSGEHDGLLLAITDIISPRYAAGVSIDVQLESETILITFPTPQETTECFFVCIKKEKSGFSYYTFEKTRDWGDGITAFLGSWTNEGHSNYGGRKYDDKESFHKDILRMLK